MIVLISFLLTGAGVSEEVTILNSAGDEIPFEQLLDELTDYDVIFVGEQHDAAGAHIAELAILEGLASLDSNLVLAMEMFERDVEEILYAYWAGDIEEDSFLATSRPWGNYQTDYRPLVEFAREKRMPIVAANVPRRAAAAVARTGEVSREAMGVDSVHMPDTLHLDSDEYFERFAQTMEGMPHGSPMGGMNIDAFYKAQVLKDAVMAQALHPYLDGKILFVCGRFHSDYHLGIPYQLARNHPDLAITVITLISADEEVNQEDRSRIADYIWIHSSPREAAE